MAILKKGGTQITAPQQNSAVFTSMEYNTPNRNAFNQVKCRPMERKRNYH